jgi:hypothetical protein
VLVNDSNEKEARSGSNNKQATLQHQGRSRIIKEERNAEIKFKIVQLKILRFL